MDEIALLEDAECITAVLNRAFLTVAQTYGYTPELVPGFPAFIRPEVIAEQIACGLKVFAFKRDAIVAGCAGYAYHGDGIYYIERLGVLPEYRHKGIGRALLGHIESEIGRTGAGNTEKTRYAEVGIVDNNAILKSWYIQLGYREIRIETYDHLPFKVCVMDKELG